MVNISGPYLDLEEFEEVDDIAVEYPCPFCASEYDLIELCHHIDEEHHLDANNGVCEFTSCLSCVFHFTLKLHMKQFIQLSYSDCGKHGFNL